MTTTINISLPKTMLRDAREFTAKKNYTSISEFVRAAMRRFLYPDLTENGFTPEFEEEVLRFETDPNNKVYHWNGKGSFTDFVLKTGKRHGKN